MSEQTPDKIAGQILIDTIGDEFGAVPATANYVRLFLKISEALASERVARKEAEDEWGLCEQQRAKSDDRATAAEAKVKRLVEALRLLRGCIVEGGVPRYTATSGAALNAIIEEDVDPLLRTALQDAQG